MVLIFLFSSFSHPPIPQSSGILSDKFLHSIEYAVLGFLLAWMLVKASPQVFPGFPWIVGLSVAVLFGASDEWHQSFVPGRSADVYDWIADGAGSALGVLVMYLWHRFSNKHS